MKSQRRATKIVKTVCITLAVVVSLLAFPSVTPWVACVWLVWHTWMVQNTKPAYVPLMICLVIFVLKCLPMTPAMVGFLAVLLLFAVVSFRTGRHLSSTDTSPTKTGRTWIGVLCVWCAWVMMFTEWQSIQHSSHDVTLDPRRPIVCIGDSLTEGLWPDKGYPDQLAKKVRVPVINLGFSGIATSQGLAQMDRVLSHNPQVVIIELGGHDFLKWHSRAQTKRNLVKMIQRCHANNAEVILMEIPRGFMFDPYARLERRIAYEHDVELVSDTWLRQVVLFSPIAPPGRWMKSESQLSDDGIHSNLQGSRAIASRVAEALVAMYGEEVLANDARPAE